MPKDEKVDLGGGGGYRNLRCYQLSTVVYDATVVFCRRCLDRRSRTVDQMVQAARSANKNIAEGSRFSKTSKKFEIGLIGAARASLEELLGDYEDYLRQNRLSLWKSNSPKADYIRKLFRQQSNRDDLDQNQYEIYRPYIEDKSIETAANTIICLIHQTNFLLDRLTARQTSDFIEHGDMPERLTELRRQYRKSVSKLNPKTPPPQSDPSDPSDPSDKSD